MATRPIESIPPAELFIYIIISLRKEDGCNITVRGMSSFDRHLQSQHYRSFLINVREFEIKAYHLPYLLKKPETF